LHADSHQKDKEYHGGKEAAAHVRVTGKAKSTKLLSEGNLRLYKVTLDDGELGITPDPGMALNAKALGESLPPPVTFKTRLKRRVHRTRRCPRRRLGRAGGRGGCFLAGVSCSDALLCAEDRGVRNRIRIRIRFLTPRSSDTRPPGRGMAEPGG